MSNQVATPPALDVVNLSKHYELAGSWFSNKQALVYAVDDVSFTLGRGETLGLVGESGCGKSTLGRTILRLVEPTSGTIRLEGEDITALSAQEMIARRQRLQVIFQDPYSSLNPRMRAGEIVGEPLINFNRGTAAEQDERIAFLFKRVGLRPDQRQNFPHEFSGGQRQRLGIARALALGPSVIIGDEPVSALDVSVQAQVINLMMDLQDDYAISYLFIAHDLSVVRHISRRIAVMYLGQIVELATRQELFERPQHPYTQALLAAVPISHPRDRRKRITLKGDVESPINPPAGCRFHNRCPHAVAVCSQERPPLRPLSQDHAVACHLVV